MKDTIKFDIPAGYAADYERYPAGVTATRIVLTIWKVDDHPEFSMQIPLGLTPLQRAGRGIRAAFGLGKR